MSFDTIDKMAERYKSVEELRIYANAQYKTIQKLSKKIGELEKINEKLKEGIDPDREDEIRYQAPEGMTDQEAICVLELSKLHLSSQQRELTLEETRKVETYVKTLYMIRNDQVKAPPVTKNIDTKELLEAMKGLGKAESDE